MGDGDGVSWWLGLSARQFTEALRKREAERVNKATKEPRNMAQHREPKHRATKRTKE